MKDRKTQASVKLKPHNTHRREPVALYSSLTIFIVKVFNPDGLRRPF